MSVLEFTTPNLAALMVAASCILDEPLRSNATAKMIQGRKREDWVFVISQHPNPTYKPNAKGFRFEPNAKLVGSTKVLDRLIFTLGGVCYIIALVPRPDVKAIFEKHLFIDSNSWHLLLNDQQNKVVQTASLTM